MPNRPWQVLVVDDDEGIRSNVEEILEGVEVAELTIHVTSLASFNEALQLLDQRHFDALVLDVRDDEIAKDAANGDSDADLGLQVFDSVRATQFIPIVFYTGLPELVEQFASPPVVSVVSKTDRDNPVTLLTDSVSTALSSGLPKMDRSLRDLVAEVSRDFMYEFAQPYWDQLAAESDEDVEFLLRRRLARRIDVTSDESDAGQVHPMRCYVTPPVGDPSTGELIEKNGEWWIVLTPSCDLVPGRTNGADRVVMARCVLATERSELENWPEDPSNGRLKKLDSLIKNNLSGKRERYFFLPGVLAIPSLVVDFEHLTSVRLEELTGDDPWKRQATLDSPFAESLINRFQTHIGRVGTPDLNLEAARTRLLGENT